MGVAVDYVWTLSYVVEPAVRIEHGAKLQVPAWAESKKRDMVEGIGLAQMFSPMVKVKCFLFF
jgi:hypothetical protein